MSMRHRRFMAWMLGVVMAFSVIPSILNLLGVDFGLHHTPGGSSTHGLLLLTILLWTGAGLAIFTFLLSFLHYYLYHDEVVPVIGICMLWGGFADMFQTLAADRFIESSNDEPLFIPLTWAIGRSFGIFLLLLSLMLLMVRKRHSFPANSPRFFGLLSLAFGFGAFAIVYLLSNISDLPELVFPNLLISRPWDMLPLCIYVIAGTWVFRKFHLYRMDGLSYGLWVSVIADIAAQIHMAFGSTELFDNHYNLAHFLQLVSYFAPMFGLIQDHVDAHERLDVAAMEREQSERERRMLVALVDNTSEMVALISAQGEIRYCNRFMIQSLAIPPQERSGLPFSKVVHRISDNTSILRNLFERAFQNGHSFGEIELVSRDASRLIPVEYSLFPVISSVANVTMFGLVMRDNTARRQISEDREKHEKTLRSLISQRTAELAQMNRKMQHDLQERKRLEN
ncbi:MAG TPA: PAS domain-containing protein, partial [Fibrobacteraceae bacterium]|nr:PAS domain-containing protein [Fibrobacteraceae bacterium]